MHEQAAQRSGNGNLARLYKRAGGRAVEAFFSGISRMGKIHPSAKLERHGVECIRDIPYLSSGMGEHLLDVYRPVNRDGPLPVCFYVHGGGFRILSKDTHWLMGLIFARRGFLVFNINYRLAPAHPFPAALEDASHAFAWALENAAPYGGDTGRLVLAGESAGANLVTALTVAACYPRPEPYARKVWDLGRTPDAVVPACGLFQVSDVRRFGRKQKLSRFVVDRLVEVSDAYLLGWDRLPPRERELADPLLLLERGERPDRPLPPFFIPVGTRDPIADDTRRLHGALQGLGVQSEARYYEGEHHAFHAFIWKKNALDCWRATFGFLSEHV